MPNAQNVRSADIACRIGRSLRLVRHLRHMTMSELADKMTELGDESVSGRMVGSWERGESEITSTHLFYIARALECTINAIVVDHYHEQSNEELLLEQIRCLSKREQEVLLWLATEWEGNKHPLIELALAYASMNKSDRAQAAAFTVVQYKEALKSNRLMNRSISTDLSFLQRETDFL